MSNRTLIWHTVRTSTRRRLIYKVNQIENEGEVTKKRHTPFFNNHLREQIQTTILFNNTNTQYNLLHARKYDGLKKLKAYHILSLYHCLLQLKGAVCNMDDFFV